VETCTCGSAFAAPPSEPKVTLRPAQGDCPRPGEAAELLGPDRPIVRTRVLIEQAANNLQSAPKHVHVTHLARLDMTEHSAVSERSTGLHRFAKITPPTSSQDRDSKLWITQRGQPAGRRAQSAVRSGCRLIGAHRLGRADQADLPRRVLARRRLETHSHADVSTLTIWLSVAPGHWRSSLFDRDPCSRDTVVKLRLPRAYGPFVAPEHGHN